MNPSLNFTVTEIRHIHFRMSHPNWGFHDLAHADCYTFVYAESGQAHYLLDGQDIRIQADQILLFQPGEPHTAWTEQEDPWRYFSFGFALLPLDPETADFLAQLPTLQRPQNPLHCRNLLFSIYRCWSIRKPGYSLEVRALLMELFRELFTHSRENDLTDAQRYRMQKAITHIHENLQTSYTVQELAQIAGFSESYFSKLFHQITGQSVITYQNVLRLTHARNLMQSGDCNVSEAAAAAGFRDVYYFSRLYKKLLGETPSGSIRKLQPHPTDPGQHTEVKKTAHEEDSDTV